MRRLPASSPQIRLSEYRMWTEWKPPEVGSTAFSRLRVDWHRCGEPPGELALSAEFDLTTGETKGFALDGPLLVRALTIARPGTDAYGSPASARPGP